MKMLHLRWTGLGLLLSGGGAWLIPAEAMDTKAAGKCALLGALRPTYRAKAEAILDTSNQTGHVALVNQRMTEEANFPARTRTPRQQWTRASGTRSAPARAFS